jgi:glycyl-tRNA synthetase
MPPSSPSSVVSVCPSLAQLTVAYKLRAHGISNKVDDSSQSIGRRYARNDELGTPYGVTVDFLTVEDGSLTLRERDSTKQIRASEDEIFQVMKDLIEERTSWADVISKYGEYRSTDE